MHLVFLISTCYSLCVDQPIPSLLSGLGHVVHVEASQVDFLKTSELLCDSTKGPFCGHAHPEIGTEFFSRALGISSEVGFAVPNRNAPNYTPLWNKFTSVRPITRSQLGGVSGNNFKWRGPWAKISPNPTIPFNAQVSVSFAPSVLQFIQFSPPNAQVLVVGRLKGQQQWRRIFGDSASLVGSDVFAKWQGNGSVFRASVMSDTGSSLHVSWRDGDQSFRSISREDVVTVVSSTVENLKTVDQLVFYATDRQDGISAVSIAELVLSVGPANVPDIRVYRSGGGLVFEDDVSAGAVLFSATELVERNLRVIDSGITSSSGFGVKLAGALSHRSVSPNQLEIPRSLRSPIMLSLFLAEVGYATQKILKIHSIFATFINATVVQRYLNFDAMFLAFLDSGAVHGSDMVSLRLQSWLKEEKMSLLRPTVAPQDTFEGTLVCSGDKARNLKISVLNKQRKSAQISDLEVWVQLAGASYYLNAEFYHVYGLLHIPSSDSWLYPLSLFLVRVDTLTLVELVGSVNLVSCGGLIMQPTSQSGDSGAAARSVPLDVWAESIKSNQVKFNAILHVIKSKHPYSTTGLNQPFVTSIDLDLDD